MDRIYVVTDTAAKTTTLVEASSQAQAVGIVVGARYNARAARPEDVLKTMQDGGAVLTRMHQKEAT